MLQQIRTGFIANLPVAGSVWVYGCVLGVLTIQKNINWLELLLMNLTIFAGASQFVMVDMWIPPLPILEISIAVLIINLRYLLIGASLTPLFKEKSLWHKLFFMHLVADENWAITMAAHREGKASVGFLFGGGVCLLLFWSFGTLFGNLVGSVIQDPKAYAFDFAFVAVFTALTVSLWQGKKNIIPWLIAAVCAIITDQIVPGKWCVVAGGIVGALTATFIHGDKKQEELI